jgi:hypothetical protein
MSDDKNIIYKAIYAYMEDSYKQQAADDGIEWVQEHNEFLDPHAASLYNQVMQAVDMYMSHFAEPLPNFSEDDSE